MKKLLLIDGNAILHRAYHALPPLTNKKGEVVNGVYGFFSMLLTVVNDLKPECIVVCFDRPKPTFRQNLYAGYQQHRPKMADDLVPQVEILHRMLAKMKVAVFEVDGYEADDLIGTISFQAVHGERRTENDEQVIILSGDRDLLQLVNSRVKMLAPVVGVKNTILYDSVKVKKKYGISPSQVVDYKALVGDQSDGYPGVSGVGPKTAASLLQKYGTLEGIYEHLGELNPKLAEKLAQGSEQAALCKKLATIVTDAPVTFKTEDCFVGKFTIKDWTGVFKEQGFKSLIKRADIFFNPDFSKEKVRSKHIQEKKVDGQLGLLD